MRRREFLGVLGGAAAAWPLAAHAQQAGKLPTIGFLGATTPETGGAWAAAFAQRLRELDWIEGRTVAIVYRWAQGSSSRAAEIAAEFVRLKVDVIVTGGDPIVRAVKTVTSVIPIVFGAAGDPVGNGLVASLARPSGNVTGLANLQNDTASKRIELLQEIVSGVRRLAIMVSADLLDGRDSRGAESAARGLGIEVTMVPIGSAQDITSAFETLKGRVDALYVASSPLTNVNRVHIITLAAAARLPTIHSAKEYVAAGGLMSYGPNLPAQYRRAAELVDKILRGARPADIPVEQPTKFDLVINLTTAKALGLTIPEPFLLRADEVIE